MKISIDPKSYIFFSGLLLLLGPDWLAAILFSAMIHELGHLTALWLFKRRIYELRILPFGARIDTESIYGFPAVICALAGPLAGGILIFLYPSAPKISFCALIQSVFNLLPVYPLDGGLALRKWLHEKAVAKSVDSSYNT